MLRTRPALHTAVPVLLALLSACATVPETAPTAAECPACPVCPTVPEKPPEKPKADPLQPASWSDLPGWGADDVSQAWVAMLSSCRAMKAPAWQASCQAARELGEKPSAAAVRAFAEREWQPWRVVNPDGSNEGLITGYYEPLIRGSRTRSKSYDTPVYAVPDDLLIIDMGEIYPELKNMRLRGRLEGRKVVPYYSRAQIEARPDKLGDKVLLWAADPIDFFFLQVQGSGQVQLADGSRVRIAYADQNGHPYQSIGRWLIDKGELKLEQAGMEGIRNWARTNPGRLTEMLNANPSFVFFREQPANGDGPNGSQGVPLTAGRSIAVDTRSVPLGAPVFLATTAPGTDKPMQRLVVAQDTGGAIKGGVRADFYWGFGAEAGAQAGKMRSRGQMWVLWPKGQTPPGAKPGT
ncbi:murein transglycosylase A [Niveibacterium sp. COAC-50]|uniref:murein transglycosylase A n=1 Tax=Niveibacterium sp. COAC-50 TaxID=2729384 RepID=UPI001552E4E2|nr:murein transglycosylase A [Niveibacterium sp. COAC-50]